MEAKAKAEKEAKAREVAAREAEAVAKAQAAKAAAEREREAIARAEATKAAAEREREATTNAEAVKKRAVEARAAKEARAKAEADQRIMEEQRVRAERAAQDQLERAAKQKADAEARAKAQATKARELREAKAKADMEEATRKARAEYEANLQKSSAQNRQDTCKNDVSGEGCEAGASSEGKMDTVCKDETCLADLHDNDADEADSASDESAQDSAPGNKNKNKEDKEDHVQDKDRTTGLNASLDSPKAQDSEPISEYDVSTAAVEGDVQALSRYLAQKPELALAVDENGWMPLHEASRHGQAGALSVLLKYCAESINTRTSFGTGGTALWWVVQEGFDEQSAIVQILRKAGAVAIGPVEDGDRDSGHGRNENENDTTGTRPQDDPKALRTAAYLGNNELVGAILSRAPDWINAVDENGWAAVHEAVREGHVATLKLLVKHGANVNARTGPDKKGWSPLAMALDIHGNDHPMTKLLQGFGALDFKAASS